MWYSIDLCEDARPFAPTMSFGSRATQATPDAFGILLREITLSRFLLAGKRSYHFGLVFGDGYAPASLAVRIPDPHRRA
jgi:hypothetical protein